MPYLLPKKEDAPSKGAILKLANTRNASARKIFSPDELAGYSRVVTWIPRFDGLSLDANKARDYSLLVSSVTNYFNKPQLIIALASAVFSLNPQSTANANNFASAIITAGDRLNRDKATQAKALAPYRKIAAMRPPRAVGVRVRPMFSSGKTGSWARAAARMSILYRRKALLLPR